MPYYLTAKDSGLTSEGLQALRDSYIEYRRDLWGRDRLNNPDYDEWMNGFPLCLIGPFDTRQSAHDATEKTHAVIFTALPTELWGANQRENYRVSSDNNTTEETKTADNPLRSLSTPWRDTFRDYYPLHAAHMSRQERGKIAYTPDEECAVANRTIRTTPGRYLHKFCTPAALMASAYGQKMIAAYDGQITTFFRFETRFPAWIAQCDPSQLVLNLATTPDDIEKVYRNCKTGSCMSHEAGDYESLIHPVRIYGMKGSSLAVAYIGPLAEPAARSVVWPEKHIYTRIYGDNARMFEALCQAGYHHGNLDDAILPCVEGSSKNYLVMPFIDGADSGEFVYRNGVKVVRLSESGEYEISTKETSGQSGICKVEYSRCEHCGNRYDPDDDNSTGEYCAHCAENRWQCESCNETGFGEDGYFTTDGGHTFCRSCYDDQRMTCECCEEQWDNADLAGDIRRRRSNAGVDHLCTDCADTKTHCDECETYYDTAAYDACPDCASETTENTDAEVAASSPIAPQGIVTPAMAVVRYGLEVYAPHLGFPEWSRCCIGNLGPIIGVSMSTVVMQRKSLQTSYPTATYRIVEVTQ